MTEKIKWLPSGGQYCEKCKICIQPPRARKNFCPEYWTLCDKCKENTLHIAFRPSEDSLLTDFYIREEDLPLLIENLSRIKCSKNRENC